MHAAVAPVVDLKQVAGILNLTVTYVLQMGPYTRTYMHVMSSVLRSDGTYRVTRIDCPSRWQLTSCPPRILRRTLRIGRVALG